MTDGRLQVVAGILFDAETRVLITERIEDGPFQGLWEFPGGKIAAGEAPADALRRELAEEIGVTAQSYKLFATLDHDYPHRSVRLHFYTVSRWSGSAQSLEGQGLRWLRAEEIEPAEMLPADEPIIAMLRN